MKQIAVAFILIFLLFSCGDPDNPDNLQTSWTLTGSVFINIAHSNVKLAAFFVENNTSFSVTAVKVSNTANLNNVLDFSLNINAGDTPVNNGDTIDIIIWDDINANDLYDGPESWQYTEPQAGCPVFYNAVKCCFFYSTNDVPELGIEHGWNIDLGNLNSIPIRELQGNALIQDWNIAW